MRSTLLIDPFHFNLRRRRDALSDPGLPLPRFLPQQISFFGAFFFLFNASRLLVRERVAGLEESNFWAAARARRGCGAGSWIR
jgi:hypothetical protein